MERHAGSVVESGELASAIKPRGCKMRIRRAIAGAVAGVVAVGLLALALNVAPASAKPPWSAPKPVAVTVVVPPTDYSNPVYVAATLHLGPGVWHVVGEGTAADCKVPVTTTGTFLDDIAYAGGDARFPTALVDAGSAGATVTIECLGVDSSTSS